MSATRRGYLMLEVGVCGALAGTILIGLLAQLEGARVDSITAQREVIAQQIANETLNQTKSVTFASIVGRAAETRVINGGKYEVAVAVADGSSTMRMRALESAPAGSVTTTNLTLAFKTIDVVVRFQTKRGPRTTSASSRVYVE